MPSIIFAEHFLSWLVLPRVDLLDQLQNSIYLARSSFLAVIYYYCINFLLWKLLKINMKQYEIILWHQQVTNELLLMVIVSNMSGEKERVCRVQKYSTLCYYFLWNMPLKIIFDYVANVWIFRFHITISSMKMVIEAVNQQLRDWLRVIKPIIINECNRFFRFDL